MLLSTYPIRSRNGKGTMDEMTWEQKARAINSLGGGGIQLSIAKTGQWMARVPHVEIGHDGILSSASGFADNLGDAVESLWGKLTELPAGHKVVVDAYGTQDGRRELLWDGTNWAEVAIARS